MMMNEHILNIYVFSLNFRSTAYSDDLEAALAALQNSVVADATRGLSTDNPTWRLFDQPITSDEDLIQALLDPQNTEDPPTDQVAIQGDDSYAFSNEVCMQTGFGWNPALNTTTVGRKTG